MCSGVLVTEMPQAHTQCGQIRNCPFHSLSLSNYQQRMSLDAWLYPYLIFPVTRKASTLLAVPDPILV